MAARKLFLLLVPVGLCGCAAGFNRAALEERLRDGGLQSNDLSIAEARATKPQLRFPCRIAVYLKPSREQDWRWSPEDRAAMLPGHLTPQLEAPNRSAIVYPNTWAQTLKDEGIASEVFLVPELLAEKGDLKELRLAAAKCGADALLIVHGAAQTDSYKNAAAVLNLTVVGGYVVPSSHRDSLFMIEGVLLDVDNGYVYTGAQAEGVGKIVRPTFLVEDKEAVTIAKTKAVGHFGDEFLRRMRALAGR